MSITDELRDYARHLHNVWYDPRGNVYTYTTTDNAPSLDAVRLDEHVLAIADRIDSECERQLEALYHDMSDAEYIELPKDADGEYIHIGDVMEFSRFEIDCPVTREVDGVGVGVFFAWCGERGYEQLDAGSYSHRTQSTVEDVLREMLDAWGELPSNATDEAIIAEYAVKLQLKEES